jgi:hypothetical protein
MILSRILLRTLRRSKVSGKRVDNRLLKDKQSKIWKHFLDELWIGRKRRPGLFSNRSKRRPKLSKCKNSKTWNKIKKGKSGLRGRKSGGQL